MALMETKESLGYLLGMIAVVAFSLTLPATRLAVQSIPPTMIGPGRALIAAAAAALLLLVVRPRRPRGREWGSLALVAGGVIFGFPFLTAWAMQYLPSTHGAIVLALLPLSTTLFAALRAHERPSWGFWMVSVLGSGLVLVYALLDGAGSLQPADLVLVVAVLCVSLGYSEGARLMRSMSGWQVISWALLLSVPLLIPPVVLTWDQVDWQGLTGEVWIAFLYLALVSQYLAFFAWYSGMAMVGVSKIGQLQLLQIFFTLAFAWLWLGESIDLMTQIFAVAVFLCVAWSKRLPVSRPVAVPRSPQ